MTPIAVMENWKAMGRPIRRCRPIRDPSIRQSPFRNRRIGKRLTIYNRQSRPDPTCEMMVATAAPITPMWKLRMNSRSSPTFSAVENSRNSSGVAESPRLRRNEQMKL